MEKDTLIPEHSIKSGLNQVWLKAAIVGGLWASVEIIAGSFLHNLRVPFAGSILTLQAIVLLVAFHRLWPVRGLIWRAGLICALMKSISPSYVILGPMSGIFFEALLLEFGIILLGTNMAGYLLGGAIGLLSSFIHKIITLLIMYGFNIVDLYKNVYLYIARQVNVQDADPWVLIWAFVIVYVVVGMLAASIGWYIGKKSKIPGAGIPIPMTKKIEHKEFLVADKTQTFSIWLLFLHVVMIPTGLLLLNFFNIYPALTLIALYLGFCIWYYKRAVQRLKKPVFWIQLFIITLLAAMFWTGFTKEGHFFDLEGLYIGLEMNLRAVFIVIAFSALSVELRNPLVETVFEKGRFRNLYKAMGLAFGALPAMMQNMPGPKQFFRNPFTWFASINSQADGWLKTFSQK